MPVRRLVAGAGRRPSWTAAGVPVEGPDEDAFTMAVAVVESLRLLPSVGASSIDRVELVGEFPEGIGPMLVEALGLADPEVHRHGPGPEGFAHAVGDVAREPAPTDGAGVVVAVDGAAGAGSDGTPRAAGSAALLFADGPGAELLGRSTRGHPPERPPVAAEWIRAAHRAHPTANSATVGTLALVARAAPPVLLAEWSGVFPQVKPLVAPWVAPSDGAVPSSRLPVVLGTVLAAAAPETAVWLAAIQSDRTEFVAFRSAGPVPWAGGPSAVAPRPTPDGRPFPPNDGEVRRVSEGAYVPRARYLENLPSRWRFVADRCTACGTVGFPARGRCRRCGRTDSVEPTPLPRDGLRVVATTTIAPGAQPTEFDPLVAALGPYSVVIAEWPQGPHVTLAVADAPAGTVRVGDTVGTTLRRLYGTEGDWRYGRKALVTPGRSPASAAPT